MKARQRHKLIKNSIISVDVVTIPYNTTVAEWVYIMRKTGVIMYDSTKGGNKPTVFPKKNIKVFKLEPSVRVPKDWDSEKWVEEQKRLGVKFIENK